MSKVPNRKANPVSSKDPKTEQSPSITKNQNVSWQFNKIDMDGKWGLTRVVHEVEFIFSDSLLNDLPGDMNNDIYEALNKLSGKKFNSLSDFLNKLLHETENKISAIEQNHVIKSLSESVFWSEIMPKLKQLEDHNWFDIERQAYGKDGKTKHHSVLVSKISKEAQKRLEELKLDDNDELFSLRLTGKFRIWGIRQHGYLQILWIDPYHEVYPV